MTRRRPPGSRKEGEEEGAPTESERERVCGLRRLLGLGSSGLHVSLERERARQVSPRPEDRKRGEKKKRTWTRRLRCFLRSMTSNRSKSVVLRLFSCAWRFWHHADLAHLASTSLASQTFLTVDEPAERGSFLRTYGVRTRRR